MTINTNDLLNSILESISKIDYVKSIDIPNIDLYMDQVTTFMDKQMASSKRYEEDKVLTKTMINNYAKNNLLPSPEKEKVYKRTSSRSYFYLLFQKFLIYQRYRDAFETGYRLVLPYRQQAEPDTYLR